MVCAYAWTEIEAPEAAEAKLFCGGDDQIAIWLNGQRVHNASGSRGALERSLMPPGLTLGLKPEDMADLLAFLEKQRGQ